MTARAEASQALTLNMNPAAGAAGLAVAQPSRPTSSVLQYSAESQAQAEHCTGVHLSFGICMYSSTVQ